MPCRPAQEAKSHIPFDIQEMLINMQREADKVSCSGANHLRLFHALRLMNDVSGESFKRSE